MGTMAGGNARLCVGSRHSFQFAHQTYLDHDTHSLFSQIATVIGIGVVAGAGARFVGRQVIVALVVLILAV